MSRPGKFRLIVMALAAIGALVLIGGIAITIEQTGAPARPYPPTSVERPMFAHLRTATPKEAKIGNEAASELQYDWKKPTDTYDVYVAKGDVTTAYTTHRMIILMAPGARWMGGPLGQIVLVMRVTDKQYQAHWSHAPGVLDDIKAFGWANVIYDPWCRAYNFGYATKQACESSPDQREVIKTSGPLALMTTSTKNSYTPVDGSPLTGPHLKSEWTTPSGATIAFAPTSPTAGTTHITALKPGQKVTGGRLGSRILVLPTVRRVYYNSTGFELKHVTLTDPVVRQCDTYDGSQDYFGPGVINRYKEFCKT